MVCFSSFLGAVRRFVADDRGNAGLEFVTSIPLLLGVLIFTAEYGEALRERMILDNATHDVARFLARSPIDNTAPAPTNANPAPPVEPAFYPVTLAEAQRMFNDRVGYSGSADERFVGGDSVVFQATITPNDRVSFRSEYYVIEVEATTYVDMPLLSFINRFSESQNDSDNFVENESLRTPNPLRLFMVSETSTRWLGGAPAGAADCTLAQRYQGLCG